VLEFVNRWFVKTVAGAMALDRWAVETVAAPIADGVLPAMDRVVRRGRRLLASRRRDKRP
jgi:hypothetical protein